MHRTSGRHRETENVRRLYSVMGMKQVESVYLLRFYQIAHGFRYIGQMALGCITTLFYSYQGLNLSSNST